MAGNKKDPSYVVVRTRIGSDRLDRSFKAQHFNARSDARTFADKKNDARRTLDKRYSVVPVYPGPTTRKQRA